MKKDIGKALNELEITLNNSGLKPYSTARVYLEKYRAGEMQNYSPAALIVSIKGNVDKCTSLPGLPLKEALAYQEVSEHCQAIIVEFMEYAINGN